MDASNLGTVIAAAVVGALIAWLIISSIVKTVRFNVIRKRQGEEAARDFWNSKKKASKRQRRS